MSAMSTRRTTTTTAMTVVIVWSFGEVEELVAVVVRSVPVVAKLVVGFEAKVSVITVVGSGMCGMKEMKMYTIYRTLAKEGPLRNIGPPPSLGPM